MKRFRLQGYGTTTLAGSSFTLGSIVAGLLLTGVQAQAQQEEIVSSRVGPQNPHTEPADFPEGDGALGSQGAPHIPEPMLFDLVRPLGAARGELEVNSLFEQPLNGGHMEWAPEIEYAFADGYAIEFELPFEGSELKEYKLALQGTFGTLRGDSMIHGWQSITYYERETDRVSADLLYLNGMELAPRWSTFNMVGLRRSNTEMGIDYLGLLNNSVFYDVSQTLTLGLELNHEFDDKRWRALVVPQVHYDMSQHVSIQFGGGRTRLTESDSTEWFAAWRLIYTY